MNSWTVLLERWGVWTYADHKAIRGWYCYYRMLTHEIAFIFSFSENLNTQWKLATKCEYQNTNHNQYVDKFGKIAHGNSDIYVSLFLLSPHFLMSLSLFSLPFSGLLLLTLILCFLLLFTQPTCTFAELE